MELRSLIGKLQSPSFRTVVAIAQHAGPGMLVERRTSIRFPVGTVQVWEFIPRLPPLTSVGFSRKSKRDIKLR